MTDSGEVVYAVVAVSEVSMDINLKLEHCKSKLTVAPQRNYLQTF